MANEDDPPGLGLCGDLDRFGKPATANDRAVAVIDIKRQRARGGPGIEQRYRPDIVVMRDLGGTEDAVGEIVVVAMHEDEDLAVFRSAPQQRRIELPDEQLSVCDLLVGARHKMLRRIRPVAGLFDFARHMVFGMPMSNWQN